MKQLIPAQCASWAGGQTPGWKVRRYIREHGVRCVEATSEACKHEAVISVDNLSGGIYVRDVALKLPAALLGPCLLRQTASRSYRKRTRKTRRTMGQRC